VAAESRGGEGRGTIRRFRPEDAEAVTAIARESPTAASWTAAGYREMAESGGGLALVSETEGKVTGFLVGRQLEDEGEVLNLAVTPGERRRGQGGELLRAALDEFRARGVRRVFLEVRESNEAGIAFYAKRGFSKMGRRPAYYRNPDEAAVLMENKLTG
jgi:[ribosomal protein S18]-alanine N-acetyltransferase